MAGVLVRLGGAHSQKGGRGKHSPWQNRQFLKRKYQTNIKTKFLPRSSVELGIMSSASAHHPGKKIGDNEKVFEILENICQKIYFWLKSKWSSSLEVGLPASASVSSSHGGKSRTRETPPEQRNQSDGEGKMVDGALHVQEVRRQLRDLYSVSPFHLHSTLVINVSTHCSGRWPCSGWWRCPRRKS